MLSLCMYLSLNDVGRGMKNGENFSLLYNLADKLNAAGMLHMCAQRAYF